ncbi:MAG: hypothetical protein NVSMB45_01550 [Ginsengibacter sp.]
MSAPRSQQCSHPEVWGGIECTINRVGDQYFDQLDYAGHYNRPDDLKAVAGLGISKLRYPVLWEYHEKEHGQDIDWHHSERQLLFLKSQNIDPIVSLVHHGSGPSYTDLSDPNFPNYLAAFAGKVAEQFPWIKYYTPVNEPLTTARFSGLYGYWYPHKSNDISFAKMLFNQVKGVVLSMRAIRKVNPDAQLVQTEDLGKTYSTHLLAYQATFENHRRWLTYDLLTGNIDSDHPMWQYFTRLGIPTSDLLFFRENTCPPDIMGMNYYVTSERYLDEDISKYEPHTYGSNELQNYADVEVVRIPHSMNTGLKVLLKEAWERYHLPLAITEAHLNCTRDEQLRWLKEKWEDCCELLKDNIPVVGYTIWSLFGAYGWNRLLLTEEKDYEPGAFDVQSGKLRATAIAELVRELSTKKNFTHPITEIPGWWGRNIRFLNSFGIKDKSLEELAISCAPIIIIGKTGTLGKAFARACSFRKINYVLVGRNDVDITQENSIRSAIEKYSPWAIINAAGYVRVDEAENNRSKCFNENTFGVKLLARITNEMKIRFITFSSDLVFDGNETRPYVESDIVHPLNVYGKSKALAELLAIEENPQSLVVRTSSFFSPYDQYNFVHAVIQQVSSGMAFRAANDIFVSPTYVPDLVNTSLDILIDNEKGVWHLSSGDSLSWSEMALRVCEVAGLDKELIESIEYTKMGYRAPRPKWTVLGTEKGILLPSFESGLIRYVREDSKVLREGIKK